ncbi:MAG TPA: ABC transporter transmembrane domain-containing protein [Gemmatimonadaceae bacterium]|nr:ABC transporter transmembrane domain-containing protein [Gemmatimonadaceae bacterium]
MTAGRKAKSPEPLKRLIPLIRPYLGRLAVATLCLLAAAAVQLIFPQQVRILLDAAFQRHDAGLLNRIALVLLGLFAFQGLMNFVQVYLLTGTSERVVARLREDLFAHVVQLSPAFFTERRTGELTSRLSADLAILQTFLNTNISEISRQTLFLIGGLFLLTRTHATLTLTTLAVTPIIIGAAMIFGRALRKASTGVQDLVANATGHAEEAFSQIRTVQGFVRERYEARHYGQLLADVVRAAIRRALLRASFFGVVGFAAFGGVVAVLWQGGRLVLAGELTPGGLVEFLLYAFTVATAIATIVGMFSQYQEAVGAATRVFELLATAPTVPEPPKPEPLARPVRGEVRFENVSFRYTAELPEVLHDISLAIAPGEVVALVGPSGAGKTTVASLLPRFWDVTTGSVTVDGHDVRALTFGDLRGSIGIVPQEPVLFSGTLRENIAYARDDATDEQIVAAARAAHAWEFIERLADGLNTRVGERGVKLSGGQRQRIAIARVFLKDPAIVVLDEATSSLDSESERLVEEAMEQLLVRRSTLIIAHRLSTVRRADRVMVLDRGRIVEEGTHDALVARDGTYARLYKSQFRDEIRAEVAGTLS